MSESSEEDIIQSSKSQGHPTSTPRQDVPCRNADESEQVRSHASIEECHPEKNPRPSLTVNGKRKRSNELSERPVVKNNPILSKASRAPSNAHSENEHLLQEQPAIPFSSEITNQLKKLCTKIDEVVSDVYELKNGHSATNGVDSSQPEPPHSQAPSGITTPKSLTLSVGDKESESNNVSNRRSSDLPSVGSNSNGRVVTSELKRQKKDGRILLKKPVSAKPAAASMALMKSYVVKMTEVCYL